MIVVHHLCAAQPRAQGGTYGQDCVHKHHFVVPRTTQRRPEHARLRPRETHRRRSHAGSESVPYPVYLHATIVKSVKHAATGCHQFYTVATPGQSLKRRPQHLGATAAIVKKMVGKYLHFLLVTTVQYACSLSANGHLANSTVARSKTMLNRYHARARPL